SVAALAGVPVQVDAGPRVPPGGVAADHRPGGAVGHVDAVLGVGPGAGVPLDQDVVAEPGEDAPRGVVVAGVAAEGDVVVGDRPDAGPGLVDDREPLDRDVTGPLQVDPVGGDRVAGGDPGARVGQEGERGG